MLQGDDLTTSIQLHREKLKNCVRTRIDARLRGRFDVSDVVQEVCVDALRRLPEFESQRGQIPMFVWLRSLALQRVVDLHRQHLYAQARNAALEAPLSSIDLATRLVDQMGSVSEEVIRRETTERVQRAIEQMDEIDREMIVMRHFEMLANDEIAVILGLKKTAASNRYIRALQRLKDIISTTEKPTV